MWQQSSLIRRPARRPKRLLNKRIPRRPNNPAIVIQHDLYRHVLKQHFHASFIQESLHEPRFLHLRHVLRRDTAPNKNTPGGHKLQRAIPGLSPEHAHKDRQRLIADRGLALQCRPRNQRGRIPHPIHLRPQPLRLLRFVCIPKKIVNILDPRPRENSLTTDASVFFLKVSEQLHFEIVPRCEVGMTSLASKRMMPESIPIQPRHPQPSARRNYRPVSLSI